MEKHAKTGGITMTVKIEVFYTPTCPYCPMAKKVVKEVAPQFGSKVEVEEVNAWENQERTAQYGIMSVPAIVINGKVKFVGVPQKDDLIKAIKEAS
jgi:small redox-active disulfide protein 1